MCSIRHIALSSLAGLALFFAVPGCEVQHPDMVPTSAQMMGSGNQMIHFIATNDGTAYIYDKTGQRLVWSGKIANGQAVDVDPVRNQITVGGMVVANRILHPNSQHMLYFDPVPAPAAVAPAPIQPSNNSVIVTPNATVQQGNVQAPPGSVTVQPGLSVSPTTQPSPQR